MRTQAFKISVAALTFALGVTSYLLLGLPGEIRVSEPAALAAFRLEAEPVEATETCPLHDAAMRVECVPFKSIFGYKSLSTAEAERESFPNSHRPIGWCAGNPEPGRFAFVCPKCRAAEVEWKRQRAAALAAALGKAAAGR